MYIYSPNYILDEIFFSSMVGRTLIIIFDVKIVIQELSEIRGRVIWSF